MQKARQSDEYKEKDKARTLKSMQKARQSDEYKEKDKSSNTEVQAAS